MDEPVREALSFYTQPSELPQPTWEWANDQLAAAGMYWVDAPGERPHARPVWGVWDSPWLFLSVGSPELRRRLRPPSTATVHLESAIDVVIAEGRVVALSVERDVITKYDRKYDWQYEVDQYGPLVVVEVDKVMAWRSAGRHGRDGFQSAARWRFAGKAT